jgi:hypothetical protein
MMTLDVGREVAALRRMTAKELRQRYAEVFGEATNGHNRDWLVKRIAWRLQAKAEGGLSERARARAAALADDADLRMNPPVTPGVAPQTVTEALPRSSDDRLPPPGTLITRKYKGGVVQVKVLPGGFEYDGAVYASLSAAAKAITGSHCNGFLFFRLNRNGGEQ